MTVEKLIEILGRLEPETKAIAFNDFAEPELCEYIKDFILEQT